MMVCGVDCDTRIEENMLVWCVRAYTEMLFAIVNSLKDQLEDLKKRNQNSQVSTEKVNQLQRQVGFSHLDTACGFRFMYALTKASLVVLKGLCSTSRRKSFLGGCLF